MASLLKEIIATQTTILVMMAMIAYNDGQTRMMFWILLVAGLNHSRIYIYDRLNRR